jgi:hypothetical protein
MPIMTMEEQQMQAQFGLQLSDEEKEAQIAAIEAAWDESLREFIEKPYRLE